MGTIAVHWEGGVLMETVAVRWDMVIIFSNCNSNSFFNHDECVLIGNTVSTIAHAR